MAAVAAIVAAGGREGGMFVPGAPHLGGSARTRAGRGSVLTIYVYMPPQSHSLHVYQLWSIIKVINKTAYRKENLTILIFCEAYSKKEKKCFWWHRNSSAMIANKLDMKLTHYTATSIYYKSHKCTNFNIKHFCNHISTCPLFLILVKHLLQSELAV